MHIYLETPYSSALSTRCTLSKNMFTFSLEITLYNSNILLWFDPLGSFYFFFLFKFFFSFSLFSSVKTSSQKSRQHFNRTLPPHRDVWLLLICAGLYPTEYITNLTNLCWDWFPELQEEKKNLGKKEVRKILAHKGKR